MPGIKPDRGDVILGGALVLAAALDSGGFDVIEVTEAGLREGVFFERLLGEGELFEDVRRESVLNLGHRFTAEQGHVDRVAELSLAMFDGLAEAGLHDLGAVERELLWAACVLHDIGTAIDYDDHHRHSQYLILNAGLPGFTQRELVMVGLIARYHRKGDPDTSELGSLEEDGDARAPPAALRDHPARRAVRAEPRRSDPAGPRGRARRDRRARRRGRSRPRPERADLGRPPRGRPAGGCHRPRGGDRVRGAGAGEPMLPARGLPRLLATTGALAVLGLLAIDIAAVPAVLPSVRVELGSSSSGLVWVQAAYLLGLAVTLLLVPRTGVDHRLLAATGVAVFAGGALLASTADETATVVTGRTLQGIGMAGLIGPALESLRVGGRGTILFAGTGALLALAVAPLAGGAVAEEASWPWLFRIELVAVIPALLLLAAADRPRAAAAPARGAIAPPPSRPA